MMTMRWAREQAADGSEHLKVVLDVDLTAMRRLERAYTRLDRAILRDGMRGGASTADRLLALETLARVAWGLEHPSAHGERSG